MFHASMKKNIVLILVMILLIYGVQGISYSQVASTVTAGDDDTAHKHDGFFLRFSTGIGRTISGERIEREEFTLDGFSGNSTIGIGYAITEEMIPNLVIFGSTVQDPIVKVDGKEIGEADAEITISNIGIGTTHYFMPSNVYVSTSFALANGIVKTEEEELETDIGMGINLSIGKEWWVSDNWGIGVAAQLSTTVIPDKNLTTGEELELRTRSIGILFSATFN